MKNAAPIYSLADGPKLLGLVALHALLAGGVRWLFDDAEVLNFLWLTTGISLAAVLLHGNRFLPAVFLGALLGYWLSGAASAVALAAALRHALTVFLAVWLLQREGRFDPALRRLDDFLRLLALAAGCGLMMAVLLQLTASLAPALTDGHPGGSRFSRSLMGHMLGILVILPGVLIWQKLPAPWKQPRIALEGVLVLGLSVMVGQIVFFDWFADALGHIARGHWMFLMTTLAAVRLGPHGTVLILPATAAQGIIGAELGVGFFSDDIAQTGLGNYFFYMFSLSMVGMVLTTYFNERKQSEEALRQNARQLKTLSRHVLEAQETERRRVAIELHDELGQALTAIKINLLAHARFKDQSPAEINAENIAIVETALQQVRRLALALRPAMLDDLGLVPALHWIARQTEERGQLRVVLQADGLQTRLAPEIETACFRIVQESLTNILRHAGARQVNISLRREGEHLTLCVHDDGCGFDLAAMRERALAGASMGLPGMLERAALIGGRLDIQTHPGQGSQVCLHYPAPLPEEAA